VPDLGALIADFLQSAETDGDYTREQLRDLRGTLAHVVASPLAVQDPGAVSGADVQALVEQLRTSGVSAQRAAEVVHSLRLVFAHAIARGLVRSSPLVGVAAVADEGTGATSSPSPTTAIIALGAGVVDWLVKIIVIAFVLTAIGLAVALV
jgi:site-specific recombinase XerD